MTDSPNEEAVLDANQKIARGLVELRNLDLTREQLEEARLGLIIDQERAKWRTDGRLEYLLEFPIKVTNDDVESLIFSPINLGVLRSMEQLGIRGSERLEAFHIIANCATYEGSGGQEVNLVERAINKIDAREMDGLTVVARFFLFRTRPRAIGGPG